MKSALALAVLTFVSVSFAQTAPSKVGALFNKMYVPGGFDSNDHIQFVGEGHFRNSCYRPAPEAVRIDQESQVISVGPVAYEYSGFCLQVILPFQRVVDVGILKPGKWTVLETDGTSTLELGEISIAPALSNSPDNSLYAPVSQAFFKQTGKLSRFSVTGNFPNSCMKLVEVKATLEKDVIVLQPFAELDLKPNCSAGAYGFSKDVTIPEIPPGRYLLHVRSMNGNAINNLIDVK